MPHSAAHRGVLTHESRSHVCPDGQFEDFRRRQISRIHAKAAYIITRYRKRMTALADETDAHQATVRGLSQPTGTGAHGLRVEDES